MTGGFEIAVDRVFIEQGASSRSVDAHSCPLDGLFDLRGTATEVLREPKEPSKLKMSYASFSIRALTVGIQSSLFRRDLYFSISPKRLVFQQRGHLEKASLSLRDSQPDPWQSRSP